ncbi:MAG: G8 domain-containing protein, partial [Planctomycetota bacterium]
MASRALLRKQLSQPLESLERRLLLSAADVDDFATSRSAGHLADALPLHHGDPAGAVGRSGVPRLTTGTTVSVRNGSWTSPSTWSNGVPNDNLRAIVSQSTTVTLAGNAVAGQVVVHGTLTVAEQAGVEQTLTTDWVHVNSGGLFRIGSASNRYDQGSFTLTLTGTDANADYAVEMASGMTMQINNNDGFLMAAGGGRLQFFGKEKLTFSKLSQTAAAGSNVIFVENVIERNFDGTTSAASDGSVNWEVGDQIVIASSSRDYADEEVRTITAISNVGNTKRITLD